ncbi:29652_t:CDS:1, partial [Gigaspora margarita]
MLQNNYCIVCLKRVRSCKPNRIYITGYHEAILNLKAKYWKAFYLLKGYGINEDKEESKKLLKEIANNDSNENLKNDAQLLLNDLVKTK